MSDFEEEVYSTMFTSLKHSTRRKILRMLSKKPRSFSEILKDFGISSSHLTYHLESLGGLVFKTNDGNYKLSKFGEAAVGTMSEVEEASNAECSSSLPLKWKSFFVVLTIGLVVLASVSYTQYQALNLSSVEFDQLSVEHGKLKELNDSLESEYEDTLRDVDYLEQLCQDTLKDYGDLESLYQETLEELLPYRESNVVFTGDVSGICCVEVKGNFLDISSNVSHNDVELTFSSTFGEFEGTHIGYLHMERRSEAHSTMEIYYTYGPENDLYYHLRGSGTFEVSNRTEWFTIDTTGYEFTLSRSVAGKWILVWEGYPSFTIGGKRIGGILN